MIEEKGRKIIVKRGDITKENTDAIVNPANSSMEHGGGAAYAIVKAGGEEIQLDSNSIIEKTGYIPTGKAIITDGYKLPCKFVIHVVGPRMGEGNEREKLRKAINSVLILGDLYNLKSISIPAVSSGIFKFPKKECARILLETSLEFLKNRDTSIEKIFMCNRDKITYDIFCEAENKLKQ